MNYIAYTDIPNEQSLTQYFIKGVSFKAGLTYLVFQNAYLRQLCRLSFWHSADYHCHVPTYTADYQNSSAQHSADGQ